MVVSIVIHKDPTSGYGVTIPDLPGCFSGGESCQEAMSSAHEAVVCHEEGLRMDGQMIPEPKPVGWHQASEDYEGGIWTQIEVDLANLSI